MAKFTVQHTFRLNLTNPDHLLVHQTLKNLNKDIHKSVSNFVIEALIKVIKGTLPEELTYDAKELKERREGLVTRREFDERCDRMENEISQKVTRELMNVLFSSIAQTASIRTGSDGSSGESGMGEDTAGDEGHSDEVKATLSELSEMWS